jgi:ABC transport system ATP-binding/permease protein
MGCQRSWIVGRLPDCDLVVDATAVSGRHCRLTQTDQGFLIEDLQSSNGTFVNGTRIKIVTPVTKSDRITLGRNTPLPWPRDASDGDGKVISIGRDPENDVVLDYPMISTRHARVILENGRATLEDLGSTNGTAIGHPEARVTTAHLAETDVVYFGSFRVPATHLLGGKLGLGQEPHQSLAFRSREMVFGRAPDCDQVLNYPNISGRHARLSRSGGRLVLQDLGSTNGTFVNGQRVYEPTNVQPGDVIAFGSYTFTVTAGDTLEGRDSRGNLTIAARQVAVDVPGKRLLDDVSLTIFPSEFVGLMGPSGAGKTTLMSALNGYVRPTSGEVQLNGQDLYANYARFATHIGYVPQDDIIHRDLTVGQALYYTARLRLPADYSESDIRARIRDVLHQLGLDGIEDVLVGSPEKKGISGGQRKRVNLAMELMTDPLVLFLDEPTSGLSSEDALVVMKLLRKLADDGRTILLTIHQPSLAVFRLMDNLVVVSRDINTPQPGRLVYYGPAYPDSIRFFNPDGSGKKNPEADPSPDDLLRSLARDTTSTWAKRYASSRYHRDYVVNRATQRAVTESPPTRATHKWGFNWLQWVSLSSRCLAIKSKDTINTAILFAQAPIIAILVVLLYGSKAGDHLARQTDFDQWQRAGQPLASTLFLTALAAIWFGCSNAVREIVGEWAIYRRERMVNLKIASYVASKFTVLGALCLVQCSVLLGVVYAGCGLSAPWLPMFFVLFLAAMVGLAFGLTISAVSKTSEMAIAIVPLVLLPMVMFGGTMQPIYEMPPASRPICGAMPSRWAFETMLVLESDRRGDYSVTMPYRTTESKDMADPLFPTKWKGEAGDTINYRSGPVVGTFALGLMLAVLYTGVHLILKWRDIH